VRAGRERHRERERIAAALAFSAIGLIWAGVFAPSCLQLVVEA
jgi:hypothetical protein